MNNGYLSQFLVNLQVEEESIKTDELLRERQAKLTKIVEAIRKVASSPEWSSLKSELFDGLVDTLHKELAHESRTEDPDVKKLNRLTGQLIWAERYADLNKLADQLERELHSIKTQLHGKTKERPDSRGNS